MLTSCKNTLKEIGYLNKIENPDSLQRTMEKLPFGLRQRWRDVADEITEVQRREVTIKDIAAYVEKKARASNHPIFGKISKDPKTDQSTKIRRPPKGDGSLPRGSSFATRGDEEKTRPKPKCPSCSGEHWLSQCDGFKSKIDSSSSVL